MRFGEILLEKGIAVGEKELRQALARSDEFTYGFEAEFVHNEVDPEDMWTVMRIDSITSMEDILQIYRKAGADERQVTRTLETYIDRLARNRATLELDRRDIDHDDDPDRYRKIFNSVYGKEYQNLTKEWDLTDKEKIQLIRAPSAGIFHIHIKEPYIELEPRDAESFKARSMVEDELGEKVRVISPATKADYAHWNLTTDSSIEEREGGFGVEIISPVYEDYERFIYAMNNIFNYISENGYTNDSCGFHVNIGVKDTDTGVDLLKLQLLMGDEYITKLFGREANYHAEQIREWAKKKLHIHKFDPEARSDPRSLIQYIESEMLDQHKYKTVNISKYYDKNYIEFRAAGGENYEKKTDKIEYAIKRYLYGLVVATDPKVGRKEYLSKLARLVVPAQQEMTQEQQIMQKMTQAGISPFDANSYVKSVRPEVDDATALANRLSNWLGRIKAREGEIPKLVRGLLVRDLQRSPLSKDRIEWDRFITLLYERTKDENQFNELVKELNLKKLEPKGAMKLDDIRGIAPARNR